MLNRILELFTDVEGVEEEFDNTYFKDLCSKKRDLEVRIDNCLDVNLHDVLSANLTAINMEINLIVINEKKRQGIIPNSVTPNKKSKERVIPIFVNGEIL